MDYLSIIILHCINEFKGERTAFAIYHLLTGKKSAQTIQDGQLYRLAPFFQIFPSLKKQEFIYHIRMLEKRLYIKEQEENIWMLTKEGRVRLSKQIEKNPFSPCVNGWQYMTISSLFLDRLTLLIQTLSNLVYNENRFLPIMHEAKILSWVKEFLVGTKADRFNLAKQLYDELTNCLEQCSEKDAQIFMLRFSGFNKIGLTKKQIADLFDLDEYRVHYVQLSVLHCCLKRVVEMPSRLPLLYSVVSDVHAAFPLTSSTSKTFDLLKQGKTFDEIMNIRRLKKSTVEDHIAELALFVPSFSIKRYVPDLLKDKILKIAFEKQTNKLRDIKEAIGEEASYFQIRLVLAKYFR